MMHMDLGDLTLYMHISQKGEGGLNKRLHVPLSQHLSYCMTHCLLAQSVYLYRLKWTLCWIQINLKETAVAVQEIINTSKRLNIFTETSMPKAVLKEG